MAKLQHKHAAVILAAGASSRMGYPKALLKTPAGDPLAAYQATMLRSAGVADVFVVVGHEGRQVANTLVSAYGRAEPPFTMVDNPDWETGRISSLQAGMRMAKDAEGVIVLPVDTAGVRTETIVSLLQFVSVTPAIAIRPVYAGNQGNLLWLSTQLMEDVMRIVPGKDVRFDDWVADKQVEFDVDDSAILNNLNTPEAWEKVRQKL